LDQRVFPECLCWLKADAKRSGSITLGSHLIVFLTHFKALKQAKMIC